jgi:hypothetical protein
MTEQLSALALRFEKANNGMLIKNVIIKQNKLESTREKATRTRPETKASKAKHIFLEHKDRHRSEIVHILMNQLNINYNTASVYACNCNKHYQQTLDSK